MPSYRITAPDGHVYNVTPPEGTNPSQAEILAAVQAQHGGQPLQESSGGSPGGVVGQFGLGALQGLSSLPGLPVDMAAGVGNFIHRQLNEPEVPVSQTGLKNWGGQAWYDWAQKTLGVPQGPAPASGAERVSRKLGAFMGGSLPFGPAAMVPAAAATGGSEVGRAVDQAAPDVTHGYGETIGALGGAALPGAYQGAMRGIASGGTEVAPTTQDLRTLADLAFNKADKAGVIIHPQAFDELKQDVTHSLGEFGYDPALQPGIKPVLDRLDSAAANDVGTTLKGLMNIRRVAGHAASDVTNPSQQAAASHIIDHIDNFIQDLPERPGALIGGDAGAAATATRQAMELWSRMRKSETIDRAMENARIKAGRNDVPNIDRAMRAEISSILLNPRRSRGFTNYEKELMAKVAMGAPVQNFLRKVGKFSPESGFIPAAWGMMSASRAAFGDPFGLAEVAPSVAGLVARPIANAMTEGNIARLQNAIRLGKNVPGNTALLKALLARSISGGANSAARVNFNNQQQPQQGSY